MLRRKKSKPTPIKNVDANEVLTFYDLEVGQKFILMPGPLGYKTEYLIFIKTHHSIITELNVPHGLAETVDTKVPASFSLSARVILVR